MSRVFLNPNPMLPSECLVCKKSSDGSITFVDFNVDFDFYGAVVICEYCIAECVQLLEPTVPLIQFEAIQQQLEVANAKLSLFDSLRTGLKSMADDLDSAESEGQGFEESNEYSDDLLFKSIDKLSDPEPNADGPDSVGGLEDVPLFAN